MNPKEFAALVEVVAQRVNARPVVADVYPAFQEALRQAGIRQGILVRTRPVMSSLYVSLLSGTTTGTNDFQVPSDEVFLVKEVRGTLGFNAWESEPVAVGNMNPLAIDRMAIKAANCKINLKNLEDGSYVFTPNNDLILASILPMAGGQPVRYDENGPGFILKPAQKIRMSASLQSTNTNVIGASSSYGVILSGVMLSVVAA